MSDATEKVIADGILKINDAIVSAFRSQVAALTAANARLTKEVEELRKDRGRIVCICGSSRFSDICAVIAWNFEKQGAIALSLNFLPDWYGKETGKLESHHYAEQENVAEILDALHLRKIDLADSIFIVNKDGYIGDRTRKEIDYATSRGKPVTYLEPIDAAIAREVKQ